ncbi:MAG: hypothetical protein OEV59_02925 [Deltaproteobacteria bacterium]|nr:hypothetical protein [Deltaproteobacteria bacterium]
MNRQIKRLLLALFAAAMLVSILPTSGAAETAGGTTVTNNATVYYSDGVTSTSADTTLAPATFKVDNRVEVTMTLNTTSPMAVVTGAADRVHSFTLTNGGNTTQRYSFAIADGGTFTVANPTTGVKIFAEICPCDGIYNGTDVDLSAGGLTPDVAPGATIDIHVWVNIPGALTPPNNSTITLTATTHNRSAVDVNATTETNLGLNTEDAVFNDVAGATDAATDGKYSVTAAYTLVGTEMTITKSVALVSDPLGSGLTIPGAIVEYTIIAKNGNGAAPAASSATLSSIQDFIDIGKLTIVADSVNITTSRGGSFLLRTTDLGDGDTDGVAYNSGTGGLVIDSTVFLPAGGIYTNAGELQDGQTITITFQATIQ